jgi:hypothetical protein
MNERANINDDPTSSTIIVAVADKSFPLSSEATSIKSASGLTNGFEPRSTADENSRS